jgi:gluconokinase
VNDITRSERPCRIVVMGVSAVGKSTIAKLLAGVLDLEFVDADDLHPRASLEKMASGIALTDEDRWPWLKRVGEVMTAPHTIGMVVACSALRRAYRDRIRDAAPDTFFVFLEGSTRLLEERATARTGHFMQPSLLESQLATLERLAPDERGVRIGAEQGLTSVLSQALTAIGAAAN